jgi:RIO kinase 1
VARVFTRIQQGGTNHDERTQTCRGVDFPRAFSTFKNQSLEEVPLESSLEPFLDNGMITEVIGVMKSGKEATVYCCRGGKPAGADLVAAKVYRSREHRNFKNDAGYWDGYVITNGRARRAFNSKTEFGKEVQFSLWIGREYETLKSLYDAGADVPRPIKQMGDAMLMEFIGDLETPAENLNKVKLPRSDTPRLYEKLMSNIELWLAHNRVHGDLSPYNIMHWKGTLTVIDFPQACDPRMNKNAFELLRRDISNVYDYFVPCGVKDDAFGRAAKLWSRFLRSEL